MRAWLTPSPGAGAAGSSAAYHLQKYAEEEGLAVNITLFEKTDHIGGRTLTVNAFDDPHQPVELGASIFVTINHILFNASRDFDLPLTEMSAAEPGDITAIWDGNEFVFQSAEGTSWWWDAGKLWWRYGLSPYKALNLIKSVIGTFLKLYEEPYFPFRSLTQRVYELGLEKVTGVTGEQFLAENNVSLDVCRFATSGTDILADQYRLFSGGYTSCYAGQLCFESGIHSWARNHGFLCHRRGCRRSRRELANL